MDIAYLVWLQELRGEYSEKFFELFTDGSVAVGIFIAAIIFWCVDKKAGKFLLLVMAFSKLFNQFLKNTFCVYRPFILDSSVHPTASAMAAASSYSFPSGHTNIATATFGGIAYWYRKNFPLLIIPCAIMILMTAFSRNFLGVHTPQDVLTAIFATCLIIFFVDKLMKFIDGDAQKETLLTIAGIILALIMTAYFLMKSYPIDYLDGKIIVTAERAIRDAMGNIGIFAGILIGLELERRFINFKTNVQLSTKIFRVIIGGVLIVVTYFLITPALKFLFVSTLAKFLSSFLIYFAITFLVPLMFTKFEKKKARW